MPEGTRHRLAAILAADVVGYDVGREYGGPTGDWDAEARKHLTAQANPGGQRS